jgi:hypothetical protein
MSDAANYHCPVCGTLSEMILGPTQAFCTNRESCKVLVFDPSLPDGGWSNMKFIDWKIIPGKEEP